MKTILLGCILLLALVTTQTLAADSHEQRVAKVEADLRARRDRLIQSIAELDVSLQAHSIVSKEVVAARTNLNEMLKARAWRDLSSRSTKTHEGAKVALEKVLTTVEAQLTGPRQQLALIKKAECEAWARANPEAAKLLEIQRRAEAAEVAAMNAEMEAQNARSAAARAESEAQQAQWQAQEADRKARAAQQNSNRAEDALRQHGIHSW
jgi:hypothetical protein